MNKKLSSSPPASKPKAVSLPCAELLESLVLQKAKEGFGCACIQYPRLRTPGRDGHDTAGMSSGCHWHAHAEGAPASQPPQPSQLRPSPLNGS